MEVRFQVSYSEEGDIFICNQDETITVLVDVGTGKVKELDFKEDITLQELNTFINKVKSKYNKFLMSKEASDFIY